MMRLTRVDLPTLGRPTTATTGGVSGAAAAMSVMCSYFAGEIGLGFGGPGKGSPVSAWAATT